MIGLTLWAACNVSEGLRCEGVNALRVSKIRRHRAAPWARQVSHLPTGLDQTHTHMDTDMHARTHTHPPVAGIPFWYT